jgi:hypothetical protein
VERPSWWKFAGNPTISSKDEETDRAKESLNYLSK